MQLYWIPVSGWTPPAHYLCRYLYSPAVATTPTSPRERASFCVYRVDMVIPTSTCKRAEDWMAKLDYPLLYCLWLFSIPFHLIVIRCGNSTLIGTCAPYANPNKWDTGSTSHNTCNSVLASFWFSYSSSARWVANIEIPVWWNLCLTSSQHSAISIQMF